MTAFLVHYSGQVQGVGFRATAARIARHHPVAGWVRNLPDGRVELFVQGSADAVERFLKAIRDYWQDAIRDEERREQNPEPDRKGFDIRR